MNPEIFPLKGQNALGLKFYVPSQNVYPNENGSEAIDIVATEDQTTVTIVPSSEIVGHHAGEPFTILLNRGDALHPGVYYYEIKSECLDDAFKGWVHLLR